MPSTTIVETDRRGVLRRYISLWMSLKRIATRSTLMPPPVEPTHPPMTIIERKRMHAAWPKKGLAMSLVAKPVVVMMETTWKSTARKLSSSRRRASGASRDTPVKSPALTALSANIAATKMPISDHQYFISVLSATARQFPLSTL